MLRRFDRQVVLLGVFDSNVTRQRKVTNRRDAVHVGGHRRNRNLETHLVVTLAGATVSNSVCTKFARSLHQVLGDHGTGQS